VTDASARLAEQVRAAAADRAPLVIRAGGSKDFYGNPAQGARLDPRDHRGIVAYEPTELVVTVRAGTPLAELEAELDARGQLLAFEPPHFGPQATVGGCVAAGLSGPRRASFGPLSGAVRDYMLGATLMDGRGQVLRFGGTVMKNVAGYDVARALAGSLGILGLLLEVSLKVLPKPVTEATLRFEIDEGTALTTMNEWSGQPLPISGTVWGDGLLFVRLSGAQAAVQAARSRLGGEPIDLEGAQAFWRGIREQRHAFFSGDTPLWRISVPSTAAPLGFADPQLIEWGGALRWLRTDQPAEPLRRRAASLGGHATLFRGGDADLRRAGAFAPLAPAVHAIHRRLKQEFDPAGIFNVGRMYADL
jgi:glycolate oxidase FAD binding subunit